MVKNEVFRWKIITPYPQKSGTVEYTGKYLKTSSQKIIYIYHTLKFNLIINIFSITFSKLDYQQNKFKNRHVAQVHLHKKRQKRQRM